MRVALIHDWLLTMRGGERCLEVLSDLFPEGETFTLFYDPAELTSRITRQHVTASFLNALPGVRAFYQHLLPLYPLAMIDLSRKLRAAHQRRPFDLVISVSHCAAKNIQAPHGVPHLCYCLTPMRYAWDQYDRYFARKRLEPMIRQVIRLLRRWDVTGSKGVDQFVGISEFIQQRIYRAYQRGSIVTYPPVATNWITACGEREPAQAGFLVVNALVPYKNVEVIIEAFNELALPLTIVGTGSEEERLRHMAKGNISFRKGLSDLELAQLYRSHRALIFAAEEDFGMTPVEMQAAGRPVIAFGRGGALETVCPVAPGKTGLFFRELTADSLKNCVEQFIREEGAFSSRACVDNAERFSLARFNSEFQHIAAQVVAARGGVPTMNQDDRQDKVEPRRGIC